MKFTTPVSMPVTEAQYNELKPLLESMGYYVQPWFDLDTNAIIVNNYNSKLGTVNLTIKDNANKPNRTFIPTYHRDLFLALAAMTDEPNGIAGEWWKCTYGNDESFIDLKLYKCNASILNSGAFTDKNGIDNGFGSDNINRFTKATVAEIFTNFGVSECKVQNEPIQSEIPQPVPFQCIDRRTYLAGCIIQGVFAHPSLRYNEGEIIERVDKLISELDKTK